MACPAESGLGRCSPSLSAPHYSILLASRNEGPALRRTVDDVFARSPAERFEVVIVDDASDDGSFDFLTESEYRRQPIRVARNEERKGLIFSRALSADLARGRYLVVLDAHCAVSSHWLPLMREKLESIDGRGLVVPFIYALKKSDWSIDYETLAATGCSICNPFLDFEWTDPVEIDGKLCTCTIGGGAWLCKELGRRLPRRMK